LALIALSLGSFSCGGGGAGGPNVPPGENPGVPSVVQLLPSTFIAQTNSFITLNTKVLDGNGIPVANIPVIYTNLSSIGTLSATSANTNSLGIATVTLFSTTPGFATILAQVNIGVGQVRDRKSVYFSTRDVLTVTMRLDVDSVPGNGNPSTFVGYNETSDFRLFESATDDTAEVLATVYDAGGVAVAWESVTWSSSHTEATFTRTETTTNVNGQAVAVVKVTPASIRNTETHVNISAYAGNGAANMVTLFLQPVVIDATTSSITAQPSVVNTGGTSTITVMVRLNTGAYAPDGTTVNFTTTCGTVTPFAQTTSGRATATYTAPSTPGTCTVTATAGGVTIGSVTITVTTALTVQPSAVTVDGAAPADIITFTIYGGIPGYTIATSNPAIILSTTTVATSGGTFTATVPAATAAGSVTITVRDSAGTTATATITITGAAAAALTVAPSSLTVAEGDTALFVISGGTPPYAVTSSNATRCYETIPGDGTWTGLTPSGVSFTVLTSDTNLATVCPLVVTDSLGASATATLNLTFD